jgi:hypothetical protein
MLLDIPDGVSLPVDGVIIPSATAAYLLLGAAQIDLRQRAPTGVRRELHATLDALERAAADWSRRQTAPEREDATPLDADVPSSECSTARAAELLGLSRRRIQDLLLQGDLVGRRCGRVWLVSRRSVELLRSDRSAA